MALGQILDYRRFLDCPKCAILLPSAPTEDLKQLAAVEHVVLLWPDGERLVGLDDLRFEII